MTDECNFDSRVNRDDLSKLSEAEMALEYIINYAKETDDFWDADLDAKVGKRLKALGLRWPMYSPELAKAYNTLEITLKENARYKTALETIADDHDWNLNARGFAEQALKGQNDE